MSGGRKIISTTKEQRDLEFESRVDWKDEEGWDEDENYSYFERQHKREEAKINAKARKRLQRYKDSGKYFEDD